MEINNYGRFGYVSVNGATPFTFEVLGATDQAGLKAEREIMEALTKYPEFYNFQDHVIASFGDDNNLPGQVKELVGRNPILPEIIKKQVRYMYGQGPFLFTEDFTEDLGKRRIPIVDQKKQYKEVFAWLNSWKKNGLSQSFEEYAKLAIHEYYHMEGFFTKWRFNKSRRINGDKPIRGLELTPSAENRLAKQGIVKPDEIINDQDLNLVINGNWQKPYRYSLTQYPRLDHSNPLAHPVAINYTRDFSFGENVYSFPSWYFGLKEWILGSNLNPKYINSYLKNSLNAKLHVLIPDEWFKLKERKLKEICETNKTLKQAAEPLITQYEGLKDIGTSFSYSMIQKLLDEKLRLITEVLTGEGKNQGKIFVSRKFKVDNGIQEWEFKEIPTKYKEFITSIIDFEKQAIKAITSGIGVDPALSNVGSEGLYSNSGSQVYYNFLIYMNTLNYAEEFCTTDINMALRLNFPYLEDQDIKLGFYRTVPQRLENTNPEQRLESTSKNN